ncbi:GNAT family N-acetyltransferase [Lysinibacillus halotolerans]|uniref:GNAT family N-acetyltransferase n=1 Tax=Lysinibacillus halotolerans TaxID=1368476 RepID=A0A3M8HGL2_9BACI|nr:GNAT family N-acetyltransferase [Lysinibacillus halotolerans]RND01201.1 GNAT family N-acetyltransferase [Lysinibacillus halotolerans]
MIKKIDITTRRNAEDVLNIQIPAYQVEAEIIGYDDIPPLKDTVEKLQQCGETFYGYYLNEELCGAISLKVEEGEVDIHRLIVHPNHFRKGIAQILLNYLESHLKRKTMKVATGSKNIPAIRFYKKNGFEIVKEVIVNEQLSLTYFEKK